MHDRGMVVNVRSSARWAMDDRPKSAKARARERRAIKRGQRAAAARFEAKAAA